MTTVKEILDESDGLDTAAFLRYLIRDKFPGKTIATSSLRARSIVVLQLIADVDPSVPIIFCHVKDIYPESLEYRARIIDMIGLTDVRDPVEDTGVLPADRYHCESLWAESPDDHSRRYTTIALNQSLDGFDCLISAVYHGPYSDQPRPRAKQEGRLIRVDPLVSWSKEKVRGFLKERGLPFHPKAMERMPEPPRLEPANTDNYHY